MSEEGDERLSTGVPGLDGVLNGGLLAGRNYMVRGKPGAGKTLLGLHYVTAGDHDSLFINLGQPEVDVRRDAASLGFSLDDVAFLDLSPSSEFFVEDRSYDVFPSEEVEADSLTGRITGAVEEREPDRVFVDPLTQFRYLSPDEYQFREQVLSFLKFLKERDCTAVFTSQDTPTAPDDDLQFMSDGVVHLTNDGANRGVEVTKLRGSRFQPGVHAVRIDDDGMSVYPKLRPTEHDAQFSPETLSSGVPELDALLGGGIERGTVTILSGPSGVGKTTLGSHFVKEAAGRGERSVIYLFEEAAATFRHRCESLGIPVGEMVERGTLAVEEVSPLNRTPAEFAHRVRHEVEDRDAAVVMVDGVSGYRLSVAGDRDELTTELHALGRYLKNRGVTAIFATELPNVTGEFQPTRREVSYLGDNVVFLRYLEVDGALRRAVGVLKKRASEFEHSLRWFEITDAGVAVGDPISGLRGVLRGAPERTGTGDRERTD